jgi:hypothetical protein
MQNNPKIAAKIRISGNEFSPSWEKVISGLAKNATNDPTAMANTKSKNISNKKKEGERDAMHPL